MIDKGTDSQLMRDHLLLQPQKSNKDNKDACDNKNIHTDSVRTAVATGGINASAASVKFMANHIRPTGSKNYVRHQHQHQQQQQNLMEIEQLNNVMHSADPGQQPVLSSRHGTSGNMSSLERIGEGGAVGLTSLGFKSQKDKRQKLDVAPYNLDLPNENFRCDQSSCSIRPKSGHLESLYGIHHQYNVLRPPQIVTKKCPEVEEKFFPETNVVVNAVDAASVGVRNFHGLTHIPNISDEEGDAADWLGHAMSSTSQPVEVSLESSRVTKDTTKKDGSLGSADSADVSDHVFPGQKWGGNSLDAPKSTTQTARGPHRYSTEVALPHDSAVSYRDQVILSEVRSRNPSRIVSSLVLRNECCKKLDEIIKSTAAVKHADWPSDQKRTGERKSSFNF